MTGPCANTRDDGLMSRKGGVAAEGAATRGAATNLRSRPMAGNLNVSKANLPDSCNDDHQSRIQDYIWNNKTQCSLIGSRADQLLLHTLTSQASPRT